MKLYRQTETGNTYSAQSNHCCLTAYLYMPKLIYVDLSNLVCWCMWVRPQTLLFWVPAFHYKTNGGHLNVIFQVFLHILVWYSHTEWQVVLWLIYNTYICHGTGMLASLLCFGIISFVPPLLEGLEMVNQLIGIHGLGIIWKGWI